jgi:hypothetical protein
MKSTLQKDTAAETLSRAAAAAAGVIVADSPADVQQVVTAHSKRLFGFTRKVLPPDIPSHATLFVYSVSEYGDTVDLGPGFPKFVVPPCEAGDNHGKACPIPSLIFLEEAKVDVTEHTPFTASQIAASIMKQGAGMPASLDRTKVGWFVSQTNPPQAKEIERAVEIYTAECKRLLSEGNRYAAANQLTEINDTHRRSARFLGQKVDWDKGVKEMVECPGCGEPVRKGVIWHATPHGCGYVFDLKAYKERFPEQKVPVPVEGRLENK